MLNAMTATSVEGGRKEEKGEKEEEKGMSGEWNPSFREEQTKRCGYLSLIIGQ